VANLFTRARAYFGRVEPLEPAGKPKDLPQDNIVTLERSSISLGPRYNPDQLAGRNGLGIYAKMRLDEQVKAVMNFKRDAITARGWTFKYEEESSLSQTEQDKRKRVFTEIFTKMRGSFVDALNVIATGRDYGFSLTEKIYSDVTIDKQTYIGISEMRGREPSTFEFTTDDFGTLLKVEQTTAGRRITVDMSRMIHYVHSPEFDRFFGRSDLREAYRAWYAKDQLVKLWLLYLERMAGGLVEARRTPDSSLQYGSPEYASLQEVLKNVHGAMGMISPPGIEINVHTPPTTDAYEKATVYFDLAIAKALLVPNLLGISHTGQTGAFSQSQTQLEAFFWTLNADSERLESTINEQLVRDLGDANFGDGDYPYFCFKPASRDYITKTIADWKTLVDAKSVITSEADEEHFRKLLDMPKRDEDTEPLIDPLAQQQQAMAENGQGFDQKMRGNQDKRAEAEAARQAQAANDQKFAALNARFDTLLTRLRPAGDGHHAHSDAGPRSPADVPQAGKFNGAVPHGPLRGCSVEQFNRATQRVAFTVIESRQDKMAGELTGQVAQFVAKATKKLLGNDEDLSRLIDTDPSDIAGIELNSAQKGKLKDIYRRSLASAWTLGGSLARNELERARGQRFVVMKDLRDTAADYFEVNGFRMAGNVSDGVRALIQQELQNSIKFGRTAKDTREVIWDRLVSRGFTNREAVRDTETDAAVMRTLNDLWGVSEPQTAAYLDTLSRTNLFEAMNEARFAEFTDPELGGFVVALQYSAILDDRTTDICEALNDKTWVEDSPMWDQFRPPNHFNCRSVLIPVTELDGWDGQESPEPSVQPAAGFGGTLQ
jgi:SPP1 gp7 family putative phage head morphogenesis protein